MTPRIEIILASIREGRMGEKVARWIHALAAHRTELEVGLIDLRDWPLPPYAYPATPRVMESRYPDPLARAWVGRIGGADGFIIVTPEYNHGYPPSLKNAIDYVYAGWNFKPAAFV